MAIEESSTSNSLFLRPSPSFFLTALYDCCLKDWSCLIKMEKVEEKKYPRLCTVHNSMVGMVGIVSVTLEYDKSCQPLLF